MLAGCSRARGPRRSSTTGAVTRRRPRCAPRRSVQAGRGRRAWSIEPAERGADVALAGRSDGRRERGLRRRRRDRGRQAGRPGGAPGRRATTTGTLVHGLLARYPGDRRRGRARPARHRAPPRPGHLGPAGGGPHRRRPTRRSSAQLGGRTRSSAVPRAGVGRSRRRRAASSTPRSGGRRASPPAWRCRDRGREARTRYEVDATFDEPVAVRAARVPARDRPHPPDPGAPRRPSATPWSATRATAGCARPIARCRRTVPARRTPSPSPTRDRRAAVVRRRRCPPTWRRCWPRLH